MFINILIITYQYKYKNFNLKKILSHTNLKLILAFKKIDEYKITTKKKYTKNAFKFFFRKVFKIILEYKKSI